MSEFGKKKSKFTKLLVESKPGIYAWITGIALSFVGVGQGKYEKTKHYCSHCCCMVGPGLVKAGFVNPRLREFLHFFRLK